MNIMILTGVFLLIVVIARGLKGKKASEKKEALQDHTSSDLGKLLFEVKPHTGKIMLLIVGSAMLGLILFTQLRIMVENKPVADIKPWDVYLPYVVLGILLSILIALCMRLYQPIKCYEQGLSYPSVFVMKNLYWDHIRSVKLNEQVGNGHFFSVEFLLRNGKKAGFSSILYKGNDFVRLLEVVSQSCQ